jgi:hypothetical protein
MSRHPTFKAGEAPAEETGKANAKPIRSAPGVRPVVPAVKPLSKPAPAKVGAAKPPQKGGLSPAMKPPAVAKPAVGVARVPQVPPTTPTQPLRTPPMVKPSSKVRAPLASAGQPVSAPQPQATAPRSSTSAPAADEQAPQPSTVTWPCGVPGMEEASRLLSGDGSQGKHDEAIEGLWNSLTEVELGALLGRPSPLDLSALKEAVIVRWRLANALETKPARGAPIEVGALERLLNEADIALTKLQTPEAGTETERASFASARAALAKNAVALSNFAAEFAQQAAVEAATNKATKKYAPVARLVAASADTTKIALRSKLLWASLGVSVLAAVGFHGYRYLHAKNAPVSGPSYTAAGMHGFQNESSGIAVLHPIDPSKPIDPVALAQLKAQAEASGKTVHEVGPGQYVIAPSKLHLPGGSASQPPADQQ